MGIMDLQARLLARVMSGRLTLDKEQFQAALDTNNLIRTANPRAQFPRFDYTGKNGSYNTLTLHVPCRGPELIQLSNRLHGYTSHALFQWRIPNYKHKHWRDGCPNLVPVR
jgi:hypothetical protein